MIAKQRIYIVIKQFKGDFSLIWDTKVSLVMPYTVR